MPIQFTCTNCGKILKAPDEMAGKQSRCPHCQTILPVPDNAIEAEAAGGPPTVEPGYRIQDPAVPGPPARRRAEAEPEEDREPCPVCGEMIRPHAAKCRFCGEIFDEALRKEATKGTVAAVNQDMSVGDWVAAILCSDIGCIAGIIWMIQGKPKGGKMIVVSLICAVIRVVLYVAIQSAGQHR